MVRFNQLFFFQPKVHVEVQHVGWGVVLRGRENAVSWTCCFWSGKKNMTKCGT